MGTAAENVINTSTGLITYQNSGNAVGWQFSPALDLTQYNRLVVKVHPQSVSFSGEWYVGVSLFLDVAGKGDNEVYMEKWNSATNNSDSYFTREIDLTQALKSGENHDGSEVSVSAVTQFRFRTEGANLSFQIDEIYLERDGQIYLLRNNTATSTYGTICLPFAASKPSNAAVYDVVGWNESNVYLQSVDALEAGKAYVFQSNDAEDITFSKTDTEENLSTPNSGNALTGYFDAATRYVPTDSYILVGTKWKKVTVENQNQVGLYRAYLTLLPELKVSSAPTRAISMDFNDGGTTGIKAITTTEKSEVINTLSGVQVKKPTRDIYVKGGKKYIVK